MLLCAEDRRENIHQSKTKQALKGKKITTAKPVGSACLCNAIHAMRNIVTKKRDINRYIFRDIFRHIATSLNRDIDTSLHVSR
jgi:hypothetical protein